MTSSTPRLVTLHAAVLLCSSLIGSVGYYLQYSRFQITACIPGAVDIALLVLSRVCLTSERLRAWLLLAITLAFGLVVTRLALRFLPEDFQPLRKRIYFPVMALSSVLTSVALARRLARF